MGNFYTNITLRTTARHAIAHYMRTEARTCFISPMSRGFTTVYDRVCDTQDIEEIATLTSSLSSEFHCSALASLNHDDDILWIGLAWHGQWITTYRSDEMFSGSAWKVAREFGALPLLPLVWSAMRIRFVLFETWRHGAIAAALGIPNFTVGLGFEYLMRGDRPWWRADADQFELIP